MLLAHAPAGYLLTRLLSRTVFKDIVIPRRSDRLYQYLMFAGILGAILPDFDFIYHVFVDSDKTPHHSYITHMPVFWLTLMGIVVITHKLLKNYKITAFFITMFSSAMLHLVCDTITGVIYWFYPFSMYGLNIFRVSGTHIWWVHNYMYHWTFLIEIAIILSAMAVFLRIKETAIFLVQLYMNNKKLQSVTLRIGICIIGIFIIILVGSVKFNIDNRIFHKMIKIKNKVERISFLS